MQQDDNLIRWMTENWYTPRPPDSKNPPAAEKRIRYLLKEKSK